MGNVGGGKILQTDKICSWQKTSANIHSTLLVSKTLANQTNRFLITPRTKSSASFRKSIRKFLHIKWVGAHGAWHMVFKQIHNDME